MERNAVAISEKRGRARDFSNVAGDRRPRKRVRDQAQIAARLCGIIRLLDSEAEQTRFQTRPYSTSLMILRFLKGCTGMLPGALCFRLLSSLRFSASIIVRRRLAAL